LWTHLRPKEPHNRWALRSLTRKGNIGDIPQPILITPCSINKGDTILVVMSCQILTDFQNSFTGRFSSNTHTHNCLTAFLSVTTRVGRYQKKRSPTHTHPDHQISFITFVYLQRSNFRFSSKFAVKQLLKIPPLLAYVATLINGVTAVQSTYSTLFHRWQQ